MDTHLGVYILPFVIVLAGVVAVGVGCTWVIIKTAGNLWKRLVLGVGGVLAMLGVATVLIMAMFHFNPSFADTFRIYAYTKLAMSKDPFLFADQEFHPVLMMRDVANKDGKITQISHPNPNYPTLVAMFASGKYIEADMIDDVFTIPRTPAGSLPRVIDTSLWWALTTNIHNLVSSAN